MNRAVDDLCRSASIAKCRGDTVQAEDLLRQALVRAQENRDRADVEHRLAALLQELGRAECEDHARKAVELEDRPALLGNHLMFLAQHLWRAGRFVEALPLVERALPLYERCLGPLHSETRYMFSCAEFVSRMLGDDVRAFKYHRRSHQQPD